MLAVIYNLQWDKIWDSGETQAVTRRMSEVHGLVVKLEPAALMVWNNSSTIYGYCPVFFEKNCLLHRQYSKLIRCMTILSHWNTYICWVGNGKKWGKWEKYEKPIKGKITWRKLKLIFIYPSKSLWIRTNLWMCSVLIDFINTLKLILFRVVWKVWINKLALTSSRRHCFAILT